MTVVSQKRKSLRWALVLIVALAAISLASAFMFGTGKSAVRAEDGVSAPVYRLDFSDTADRGKNTGGNSALPAAEIVSDGGVTYEQSAHGVAATVANSTGKKVRQNYIKLPSAINSDSATVAGWFYVDSEVAMYSRMLEICNGKAGSELYRIMVMPYHNGAYNGLNVGVHLAGVLQSAGGSNDNIFFEGADTDAAINMPKAKNILPLYNGWAHYAFEMTPTSLAMYFNGKKIHEKAGNFTASQFYGDNGYIALGATFSDGTVDFSGKFADIRVYGSALTAEQIKSEYDLKYTDFLTASYDFENGAVDSARGFNGALTGSASIEEQSGNHTLKVDGANNDDHFKRSAFVIPGRALSGHNELTVSTDVNIAGDTASYSYVFFARASGSAQSMLGLAAKFGAPSDFKLKFTKNGDAGTHDLDTALVPFDKWVNITFVLDGATAALYLDGALVAENDNFPYTDGIFWDNLAEKTFIGFGRNIGYNDAPIKAEYDNIKIYNKALTAQEVGLSAGIITEADDTVAVQNEVDKLEISWDGSSRIDLPAILDEGVTVEWASSDPEVITTDGSVLPKETDTAVILTATLSRGEVSMTKTFTINVPKAALPDLSVRLGTELDAVSFPKDSYYYGLMKTNLDYMMSLDKERLLYNYRRIAGRNTQGATSYGAWISTESGGAGQFESHYIIALAKASVTMPDYSYKGETVADRLTYMVTELKNCQGDFAIKHPDQSGYLGGFTTDCFDALEEGRNKAADGTNVWVPWYMNHKTGEMLLDVATYAPTKELRDTAWDMLMRYADWCSMRTSKLNEQTRARVLRTEYGGMTELFYQIYARTREVKHWNVAKFFEEKILLDNVYAGRDTLTNLHANTTIPKFLGAAAAYEVTGDAYYKTVCENAFDMVMTRAYAFGGTSCYEHWQEPGKLIENNQSTETCCSYNMLKLADYLYRWTGDKKYMDYFENVYTNHILASMAPDTGLKTYLTNTAFGFYKVYHTPDNSFWCCACTGMESFAKLPYGIYYADKVGTVYVNMFYPSVYRVADGVTITQSGNFLADQKTTLTIAGSGTYTLALRKPDWADGEISIKINGEAQETAVSADGYYKITRAWADGDSVEYATEFTPRLDKLLGSERSCALKYGPLLFVADLGNDNVQDVQGSQLTFGTPYTGTIVNKIVLAAATLDQSIKAEKSTGGDYLVIKMSTANQGELTFVPFNRIFHNRYGMYFDYLDSSADLDKNYTLDGNEWGEEFDRLTDLKAMTTLSSVSASVSVENGMLVTPANGETKVLARLSVSRPYVAEVKISPYEIGGAINAGMYVAASNAGNNQDNIKAYNIQIERTAGESTYRLSVFKFDNKFSGSVNAVTLTMPTDETVMLHVYVAEDKIYVYVNGNRNAAITVDIDGAIYTEAKTDVGLRSQVCRARFDSFRVVSPDFEVGKRVLSSAVREGDTVSENECTPASYATFKAAFDAAQAIMNDQNATQAQVNEANAALRAAIQALVMHGDPSVLRSALAVAKAIDLRAYTATTARALTKVIEDIEKRDLDRLLNSELDALGEQLKNAVYGLAVRAFTPERLAEAITAAEALNAADYTEQSWQAFAAALATAKSSDPANNAEEDDAVIALLKAQASLVAKPAQGSSGEQGESSAPAADESNDGLAIAAIVIGSLAIAAVAGASAVYFVRKHKSAKKSTKEK